MQINFPRHWCGQVIWSHNHRRQGPAYLTDSMPSLIARFMGPTWGWSGADRKYHGLWPRKVIPHTMKPLMAKRVSSSRDCFRINHCLFWTSTTSTASPHWRHVTHIWTESSLMNQAMSCHLLGAKTFLRQMLTDYQVDSQEQTLVKFQSTITKFNFKEIYLTISSAKCRPFCLRLNMPRHHIKCKYQF